MHMGCWQEPVDVAPGQTVLKSTSVARAGRWSAGSCCKRRPESHVDWRQNRPATIEKARGLNHLFNPLAQDPRPFDRFAASLDKDGRFRIDDVPPGHYELTVTIDAPPVLNRPGPVKELGQVKVPVYVAEGDDDVPVDLGEIPAEVKGR